MSILNQVDIDKIVALAIKYGAYRTKNIERHASGILYRVINSCKWRDVPAVYGKWQSVYKLHRSLTRKVIWSNALQMLNQQVGETKGQHMDSTTISAHKQSAGALKGIKTDIGKNVAGFSTKIHAIVNDKGIVTNLTLSPGNVADCSMAIPLLEKAQSSEYISGDKGYDSEEIRDAIKQHGKANKDCSKNVSSSKPVIPSRDFSNSKDGKKGKKKRQTSHTHGLNKKEKKLYRNRNIVERFFGHLKEFRGIATRYEKHSVNYLSLCNLAIVIMNVRKGRFDALLNT